MLHRYHTNQLGIMKGWLENGHDVCVLSQFAGEIEDYTDIKPIIIGYSGLYKVFHYVWVNLIRRKHPFAMDIKMKLGFPPLLKCTRHIRSFKPDIVIMRERSIYTIVVTAICRVFGYKTILFDLSPVWTKKMKMDLPHRIVRKLTPKYRISPVEIRGIDFSGLIKDPNAFFAPFLMKPMLKPEEKQYFKNNQINLFSIGKYQERKNHIMMIDAISELSSIYDMHLTIAGEISDRFHQDYHVKVKEHIAKRDLEDKVSLYINLSREEIYREYHKADLHIQPSTGEPAGSTITEAMSFSVPVISGSDNGTANYIVPGVTGEVFNDCDKEDLKQKIETIISDRDNIPRMGKAAYQSIVEKHQFSDYYKVINQIYELQSEG